MTTTTGNPADYTYTTTPSFVDSGERLAMEVAAEVVDPSSLPREVASALPATQFNPSFMWVAGRYVQANVANLNGHIWDPKELEKSEYSIRFTPLNVNHKIREPVGTLVATKFMQRIGAADGLDAPEVQALAVLWAANFPDVAQAVRAAHGDRKLFLSMEAVAEKRVCATCGREFAFATPVGDACEHLAGNPRAPRRFVNTVFLGGALVLPPDRPAWKSAEVTEIGGDTRSAEVRAWEDQMALVVETGRE
jgi:hypothetical protein